ncbi:hypothetical protein D9M69_703400 [compost metagenome]
MPKPTRRLGNGFTLGELRDQLSARHQIVEVVDEIDMAVTQLTFQDDLVVLGLNGGDSQQRVAGTKQRIDFEALDVIAHSGSISR